MVAEHIEEHELEEKVLVNGASESPSKKEKKEKKEKKKAKKAKKEKKEKKKSKKDDAKRRYSSDSSKSSVADTPKKANGTAVNGNGTAHADSSDEEDQPSKKSKRSETDAESDDDKEDTSELDPVQRDGALENFDISEKTRERLVKSGYKFLFPIQAKTFDIIMTGDDVFGKARTGTGKTLSFALPLVETLLASPDTSRGRHPRVLVMAPTRELALQVSREFEKIGPTLASTCVYGGTDYEPQRRAMRNGLDAVIGTPGRLLDHMENGNLKLTNLQHLVLDEADRMLEVGFVEAVENILQMAREQAGKKPQMILFSATLPSFIKSTLRKYMPNHKMVDTVGLSINRTSTGVQHLALRCPWHARNQVIADVVQVYSGAHGRTMIFTQTKKDANDLALNDTLKQETQVLHGDIAQKQREISLQSFRNGKVRCLVATDVAARGIDIPEVDLVVQCEPPKDVDSYIHRSGRTGRAGRKGTCICFYKPAQESQLRQVERRAGVSFLRISAPQPADIIKASARDATRFLDNVTPDVLDYFKDTAKEFIEEKGDAVDALAAALAHISGSTSITGRSMLSSIEGFTAFHMTCDSEIRGKSFVFSVLGRHLPREVRESVRGVRLQKGRKGAVFDLPTKLVKTVQDSWVDNDSLSLTIAKDLPDLEEDPGRGGGGYGGRGGGYGGRGGGGFGGRRGRGGRGGGGYGGRGRGFGGRRGRGGGGRGGGGFRRSKY